MLFQPFGDSRGQFQSHVEAQTSEAVLGMSHVQTLLVIDRRKQ